MEERLKTKSKHFYDDEILFIDELGIHLKEGVKRMNYPTMSSEHTHQINYWEKAMNKIETFKHNNRDWDEG